MRVLDRVLIAGGSEPRSRALAGVQLLPNGDLLVGYRLASRHVMGDHDMIDDGAVVTTRSKDGGRTWSERHPVAALPGWDCSGGNRMVQTPDGDLVIFVMKARRVGAPESHVHPIRSSDGGVTWGPMGEELALFDAFTEPHAMGHALLTSDGDWMLPIYGADEPGGNTYAAVAFSPDMGRTWDNKKVVARSSKVTFYEPSVARMADGRFMAVIRTQDPPFDSFLSYSSDEGRTWTEARALPFQGQTPFLFQLRSGAIACFYRDRNPQRPGVSVSVTADGGEAWTYAAQVYQGTDWNCGYPSVVRLADGRLFCVYYSCYDGFNSEVQGVYISEDELPDKVRRFPLHYDFFF